MKFKDDFKTQASIAWAIKHAMVLYPGYQELLEERLPEMSDKGQTESLRIKLRILLDMLGEPTDNWVSVEERLPEDLTVCLGYSEEYEYSCLVLFEIEKGGFVTQMDAGWDQSEFGDSVTHWQPLPSPPKTK